ncbi:UNVERIFIED_CONTAM: hypothetical protein GTU68_016997 [Idotea baltica]|nr:hypothetical protein [Idotea baltica]
MKLSVNQKVIRLSNLPSQGLTQSKKMP